MTAAAEKHTPGPWMDWDADHEQAVTGQQDAKGEFPIIALFRGKNRKANARLAAAAPRMLQALKYARDELAKQTATSSSVDALKQVDAAIARASSPA